MSDNNVNSKVRKVAIEYAGLGSRPFFVINDDDGVKFIPIERAITLMQVLTQQ